MEGPEEVRGTERRAAREDGEVLSGGRCGAGARGSGRRSTGSRGAKEGETPQVERTEINDAVAKLLAGYNGTVVPTPAKAPPQKKQHVKRPMNSFMVWAQAARRNLAKQHPVQHNAEVSKTLGMIWRSSSEDDKKPFIIEAEKIRQMHYLKYPNYKYTPKRKKKPKCSYDNSSPNQSSLAPPITSPQPRNFKTSRPSPPASLHLPSPSSHLPLPLHIPPDLLTSPPVSPHPSPISSHPSLPLHVPPEFLASPPTSPHAPPTPSHPSPTSHASSHTPLPLHISPDLLTSPSISPHPPLPHHIPPDLLTSSLDLFANSHARVDYHQNSVTQQDSVADNDLDLYLSDLGYVLQPQQEPQWSHSNEICFPPA